MMKKALTYLTILAITALPVQLISANAETLSMQMSMAQQTMTIEKCQHAMSVKKAATNSEQDSVANSCCDDNSNHSTSCQGCNDIPTATSVMIAPVMSLAQSTTISSPVLFVNTSVLHGIPQKNLLKPPRTLL